MVQFQLDTFATRINHSIFTELKLISLVMQISDQHNISYNWAIASATFLRDLNSILEISNLKASHEKVNFVPDRVKIHRFMFIITSWSFHKFK